MYNERYMLLYGGIDSYEKVLGDAALLNLSIEWLHLIDKFIWK